MNEQKIEELLNAIKKSGNSEGLDTKCEYNLFSVLGVEQKEVIMCRFLADLLNPKGKHQCNRLFLDEFLQMFFPERDISACDLKVEKEFSLPTGRRIDIAIHGKNVFIPIEVKIYAEDQENQCQDYIEYARRFDSNSKLIYLTIDGKLPSEYSYHNTDKTCIIPLSFTDNITTWLKKCYQITQKDNNPVRNAIEQFIACLENYNSAEDDKMSDIVKLINSSNAEDIENLIKAYEKAKKDAEIRFLKLLEKETKLVVENTYADKLDVNETSEHNCYDSSTAYPGFDFKYIRSSKELLEQNIDLWFRVESSNDGVYFGIVAYDKTNKMEIKAKDIENECKKMFPRLALKESYQWVDFCYLGMTSGRNYDFRRMSEDSKLFLDEINSETEQLIKDCVNEIEEYLELM